MIHRLTLQDDWKGLGEVLNEMEPGMNGVRLRVQTRHQLFYSNPELGLPDVQNKLQYKMDRAPHIWVFTTSEETFNKPRNDHPIGFNLGHNVKFYIRSYTPGTYVIRFHNMNDKTMNIPFNEVSGFKLLSDFIGKTFNGKNLEELTLLTTKSRDKMNWNDLDPDWKEFAPNDGPEKRTIELLPNEMRTFTICEK